MQDCAYFYPALFLIDYLYFPQNIFIHGISEGQLSPPCCTGLSRAHSNQGDALLQFHSPLVEFLSRKTHCFLPDSSNSSNMTSFMKPVSENWSKGSGCTLRYVFLALKFQLQYVSCELINCLTWLYVLDLSWSRDILQFRVEQTEVSGSIYRKINVCHLCRCLGGVVFFLLIITMAIKITFVINRTMEICCQVRTL